MQTRVCVGRGIVDAVHGLDGDRTAALDVAARAGKDDGGQQAPGVPDVVVLTRIVAFLRLKAVDPVIRSLRRVGGQRHAEIPGQAGTIHAGSIRDRRGLLATRPSAGDLLEDRVAESGVQVLREEGNLRVEGQNV